jgi:hypothetical protein
MSQIEDTKARLIVAWMSWWLMLSGGAVLILYIFSFSLLFCLGGRELITHVWDGTEDKTKGYTSFLYPLIFISVPLGGKIGIWLWAKLAIKIRLISEERIKKMS